MKTCFFFIFRKQRTKTIHWWRDQPKTEEIDRNKYDYGETEYEIDPATAVDDILETFSKIHKLRNRFISAADVKDLFGKLIKLYRNLDEVQKNVILVHWATEYYVDASVLRKKMNQSIEGFKSLAIIVNELKTAIEPQYMWIFRRLSTLIGSHYIKVLW